MREMIKRYWADKFWRNNIIFFCLSIVVAGLNYMYYPVMGRMMDVRHFGEAQMLLSIVNIVTILLGAVQVVIVNISANQDHLGKKGQQIIRQLERLSLYVVIFIASVMTLGAPLLRSFFSFESALPFVILGLVLIASVSMSFRRAYLQGKQHFGLVSAIGLLFSGGKLVFSIIFVWLGWHTSGAVGGLLMASLVALVFGIRAAMHVGYGASGYASSGLKVLKPELRYLASVMVVSLILTFLLSGDILVAKRFFSPDVAGQYAGISAVAKIIFFAIMPLSEVLLASVGPSNSLRHNLTTGRRSITTAIVIGGGLLACFTFFPSLTIGVLMGDRYTAYTPILPSISLAIFLASIGYMCMYYLLALRMYIAPYLAIIAGGVTLLLVLLRHGTLEMVVSDFIMGSLLLIVLISVVAVWKYKCLESNNGS